MNAQTATAFEPSWDVPNEVAPGVKFAPRRLAHGNIFVEELEPALKFYGGVCGFREVAREPGINAGFFTNGNTHHDLGIVQVTAGDRDMTGRGGHLQIPKWRGKQAGLNHFGWEMENEKQLVEAFERAVEQDYPIHRTTDHQVSHSVYLFDPDGNQHEIYADAKPEWWEIFVGGDIELISGEWHPGEVPPTTDVRYDPKPKYVRIDEAPFHPTRIARAALNTPNFDLMRSFCTELLGLREVYADANGSFACYAGAASDFDLALFNTGAGGAAGLHHVSFELADEADFDNAVDKLKAGNCPVDYDVDSDRKRAVFTRDPSGNGIEFYHDRSLDFAAIAAQPAERQPYLV